MNEKQKTFVDELKRHSHKINFQEMANHLRISKPTVSRWLEGKNLPVEGMIDVILAYLKKENSNEKK